MNKSSPKFGFSKQRSIAIVCIACSSVAYQILSNGEPMRHILPNLLFLVPYLCRLAPYCWKDPDHFLPPRNSHKELREISANEFSYEKLQEITENFYYPAVIRGLFQNSTAVKEWGKIGYLSKVLGRYKISTNFCDAYVNDDVIMERFEDAVDNEMLVNENSKYCLFFPLFSREENQTTISEFKSDVTKLARKDLNLDLIRPGFASSNHTNLHGCQMVIGRGMANATPKKFTGLGWHAEPGTNWFAQVVGRKRWHLMDPKDSNLMMPFLETTTVFRTSDMQKMNELHDRLPLYTVDLEPGDLLYNADWWWHRTSAYPGLSISVPMREVFPERTFRNNPLYTMSIGRFYLFKWGVN